MSRVSIVRMCVEGYACPGIVESVPVWPSMRKDSADVAKCLSLRKHRQLPDMEISSITSN